MTFNLKPFRLYVSSFLLAILINSLLDWLICLNFDRKSAICIYLYGGLGFALKAPLFFLPYLLLKTEMKRGIQVLICWVPFLLFFIWFFLITFFQIESLYTELEFGYIMRFPHCILQLLSALICCIITMVGILLIRKRIEVPQEREN